LTKRQASVADTARQILPFGGLIVAAALCLFSAGDRLANLPGHAPSQLSPSWFGSGNARQAALRALDQRDFGAALDWAKHVVARDPVGEYSSGLLGVSLLGVGQPAAAQQAYTIAASTGWRDEGVQTYWLMTALALGDKAIAAERLDALLRVGNRDGQTLAGLNELESSPEGRAALATRLALGPDWADWYVLSLTTVPSPGFASRLAVMQLAQRQHYRFDPHIVAAVTSSLLAKGRIVDAAQVWRSFGRGKRDVGRALVNGGFEQPRDDGSANPFDWVLLQDALVDVRIDGAAPGGGSALYINSTATTERRAAQQTLLLPPGDYVLHWTAVNGNGERSPAVSVNVTCNGSGRRLTSAPVVVGRVGTAVKFTIPSDCAAQVISIDVQAEPPAARHAIWVDNIGISRPPIDARAPS